MPLAMEVLTNKYNVILIGWCLVLDGKSGGVCGFSEITGKVVRKSAQSDHYLAGNRSMQSLRIPSKDGDPLSGLI